MGGSAPRPWEVVATAAGVGMEPRAPPAAARDVYNPEDPLGLGLGARVSPGVPAMFEALLGFHASAAGPWARWRLVLGPETPQRVTPHPLALFRQVGAVVVTTQAQWGRWRRVVQGGPPPLDHTQLTAVATPWPGVPLVGTLWNAAPLCVELGTLDLTPAAGTGPLAWLPPHVLKVRLDVGVVGGTLVAVVAAWAVPASEPGKARRPTSAPLVLDSPAQALTTAEDLTGLSRQDKWCLWPTCDKDMDVGRAMQAVVAMGAGAPPRTSPGCGASRAALFPLAK